MHIRRTLIIIGIAILIGILGYSLYVTFTSGAAERGTITCTESGCVWTAHIHAYIPISICGTDYRLPIEIGPLSGPHTHEEKNIAHWHADLPYDKEAQALTDIRPLTLASFFEAINVPFGSDRIADKKNGDTCPDGKPGTLSVFINGELTTRPEQYLWRDKDIIEIFFDTRPITDITTEVQEHMKTFPKLGRG